MRTYIGRKEKKRKAKKNKEKGGKKCRIGVSQGIFEANTGLQQLRIVTKVDR